MIPGVPISESTGVPGWETVAEERELMNLTRQYVPDGGVIVELGGEYGRSASQFAKACQGKRDVKIYTVDLFPQNHPEVGNLLTTWQKNVTSAMRLGSIHFVQCIPVQGETVLTGINWDGTPIDLLFIDAGHSYNQVKADIASWVDHVKPGGVVAFHDYAKTKDAHYLHHEVKQAVDEWHNATAWERHDAPDSLVWFVKPVVKVSVLPSHMTIQTNEVPKVIKELIEPEPEQLYTAAELAAIKGLSRSKIRKLLKDVEPAAKDGLTHLYRLEDVDGD